MQTPASEASARADGRAPDPPAVVRRAGSLTVGELLAEPARRIPGQVAVDDGIRSVGFAELEARSNRLARRLASAGVGRGQRVAILSENRLEYLEATFACAKLGAILCALNWRLARAELEHCVRLVDPRVVLRSPRFVPALEALGALDASIETFDEAYEQALAREDPAPLPTVAEPEDGLLILYTSGTTGLPKGAIISHRAELARMDLSRIDLGLRPGDGFVAWAPMFHMVSLEHAIHTLALGGTVHVVDGADVPRILSLVRTVPQWWLVLIPGMIEPLIDALRAQAIEPAPIRLVGALADLVPPQTISEASRLLRAPYFNTFGSTETGMLPCAGGRFAPGEAPATMAKAHNSLYRWRLVDGEDHDVPRGVPGEIALRGPTIFSGYWRADAVNDEAFRGGWFHMGDMFVEDEGGCLHFVDRAKYLIKSGGENIYPMEIERVLMADPRVAEAVVVRRRDARWGEVPVAFVARHDRGLTAEELHRACRAGLSSYKQPREIRFVDSQDAFPRSASGKVQRQALERWLEDSRASEGRGG